MTPLDLRNRDVVFTFNDSCNCCWKCCWWFKKPLREEDPVYVDSTGIVRKFDFKKKPSPEANALKAYQNVKHRIEHIATEQAQVQIITQTMEARLEFSMDVPFTKQQVETIEQIALEVLQAPVPRPLVRTHKMQDLSIGDEYNPSLAEYD